MGILLTHRVVLLLVIGTIALWPLFNPQSRMAASIFLAISMIGFLIIYTLSGMPIGDLRKIAMADAIGLIPLAWVGFHAARS